MPKASPIQGSFSAGELGPELAGRIDLEEYQSGVRRMENFIPTIQGPAVRRAGTRFVREVKASANRTWLVRFEFNVEQAYELEFGDLYIRFYANHGIVLSGGSPLEVVTPYSAADLTDASGNFRLRFVQSGDVVYLVHPSHAPRKLTRSGPTAWTLSTVSFEGGPFRNVDPDTTTTVYASAATGTGITLTASSAIFTSGHVGGLFYLERKLTDDTPLWEPGKTPSTGTVWQSDGKFYEALNNKQTGTIRPTHSSGAAYDGHDNVQWQFLHPGYGYVRITAIGGGGTTATADVISRLPAEVVGSGQATTRWAFGEWSAAFGWPSHVTFFKERLVLARSTDQRLWMSVTGDYENFADRDDAGVITADAAIAIDIVSDQVNRIEWMVPADVLLVGTAGGEHAVRELTADQPLGPGNVTAIKVSEYGSAPVQPVRVGNSILFVQRAGRKIRELAFSPDAPNADGYGSIDLTILAPHLLPRRKYITQLAFQQEPHSIVWAVRSDGLLMGVRYNSNRKAVAWSRHPLGGAAIVEAIDVIPHPDGDRDELWLIVRRTIGASTKRYVEYLEVEWTSEDDATDRFYVDSGLTYDGSPVTSVSGLAHLEGQVVDVLADGATHPQRTVASGAITLARSASVVHVGLPCPAKLQTLRIDAGAGDGTAQGKVKRIHLMTMRFLDTLGGKAGPTESALDIIPFRDSGDPMNAPPPAFTGDKTDIAWPGGYETEGYVWYVNDQPLPATLVAVMPQLHTQDR